MKIIIFLILFLLPAMLLFFLRSGHLPARVRKAEELFINGDYSGASEIIKSVLSIRQDYLPARYMRSRILAAQKQYLLSISEINNILSSNGFSHVVNETDLRQMLAHLYKETKQWDKEYEEYKRILELDPENVAANHRIGYRLFNQKDYTEAKKYLSKAFEKDPSLTDVLPALGISCFYLYEFLEAEKYLTQAVELENNPEACYHLGLVFRKNGDSEKSLSLFQISKKNEKYAVRSLFNIGEIYYENEMYSEALSALESGAGKLKGGDEEVLSYRYLLADIYIKEKIVKGAIEQLEKIAAENPDFRDAAVKLSEYKELFDNENIKIILTSPMSKFLPVLIEVISMLNYNVVSRDELSGNEMLFKAFNIKRTNDPHILIYFNRTTEKIDNNQIKKFNKMVLKENSRRGIFISTSEFTPSAAAEAKANMIECVDLDFLEKSVKKIREKTR